MAIGAKAIAVREGGVSRLLVIAEMPPEVDEHIDLAHTGPVAAMSGALDTLFFGGKRMLRVFGKVGESATEFELIIPDKRLRAAMLGLFAQRRAACRCSSRSSPRRWSIRPSTAS